MAEQTKPKKLRIYKFAAEYNLSTEMLIEYLQAKGHTVKGHMSLLTDEMIADISEHYKKDIESAEKHYRKISEFHKLHSDGEEPEAERPAIEENEPAAEETKHEEVVAPETEEVEVLEESSEEQPDSQETQPEEQAVSESEPEKEETESEKEVVAEEPEEIEIVDESEEKADSSSFITDSEKEIHGRKRGLTVVGKIDLEKDKPKKAVKPKQEETPKTEKGKVDLDKPNEAASKKKKLKAKKRPKTDEVDDTPAAKKKKKVRKFEVDKREVEAAIKRTMLSIDESNAGDRAANRKKKRKEKQEIQEKIQEERELTQSTLIKVTEFIAVSELANLMDVNVSEVIAKCIELGLMVSINQRLDQETIGLIAEDFGFEIEFQKEYTADALEDHDDPEETLKERAPVVTIMGHVDHGKTSLLDFVRHTNVVSGESGGITQHIGAYKVSSPDGKHIAFLDTPGHEAFTAMRARGARVTDIVVLIVAADDAVMPQTVEAINHAKAAGVPIVVAINKIDKPAANPERIRQQLADRDILVEDWGGKYQAAEISAKTGLNVDSLLEKIVLEAEVLELKANPNRKARGTVVEAQLDKGRGITATVLVQKGTLKVGDPFVAGNTYGRVRAMFDERNLKVEEVGPSTPVLVLGFESAPQAGDTFVIVGSEREAREVGLKRQHLKREHDNKQVKHLTLDEIADQISQGGYQELPIVVKGDVDGSVEALSDSLMKLSNNEVAVRVIHKGVGAISEGDVLLAAASRAIIVGFHVRPHTNARKIAETEKVDIRLYSVIYDAINEVKSALEGMLSPVVSEEMVATIEVRETFKVPKVGTIAGCYVLEGKIKRSDRIRLIREGIVIYEGELATLKRFKDDVKEVDAGYECGLNIHNFNDIKVSDIIEAYKLVETKKKLV
ncbi:MAG: translation initiation factor IF-2 [Melioribacteraceae bacterium]|nr:translation initiation factor IF-2 [Melioribacteraceae bacterium]